jgi:hypothetical protein
MERPRALVGGRSDVLLVAQLRRARVRMHGAWWCGAEAFGRPATPLRHFLDVLKIRPDHSLFSHTLLTMGGSGTLRTERGLVRARIVVVGGVAVRAW